VLALEVPTELKSSSSAIPALPLPDGAEPPDAVMAAWRCKRAAVAASVSSTSSAEKCEVWKYDVIKCELYATCSGGFYLLNIICKGRT
jgi:hypothetical protein